MKREFASLTPQEALHVAIFIEERNAEIYHQFAELFAEFDDPESLEIASTFWDMANEERQHGATLQKRYFDRYGTRLCAITAEEITDILCTITAEDIGDLIEVPHLRNGNILTISKLKVGRSPREMALEVAISAEQSALSYYTRLSEMTEDAQMKAFYREFVEFENSHSDGLKKKMVYARRTAGGTKMA